MDVAPIGSPPSSINIDALLLEREARGLQIPVVARMTLGAYLLAQLAWMVPDAKSLGLNELVGVVIMVALWTGVNAVFFRLLAHPRWVRWVGLTGALLDVVLLTFQVIVFNKVGNRIGLPGGFVFKTEFPLVVCAMIAINGLALRPMYPAILTAGSVAAKSSLALSTLFNSATEYSHNPLRVFLGPAVDPSQLLNVIVFLTVTGLAITSMAASARRTIRLALTDELAHARLRQQQAEVVAQEKITAMGELVAGISHELNTPLGAISSAVDTQSRALDRLASRLEDEPTDLLRLLRVARESGTGIRSAAQRINDTGNALRAFTHLDEADLQPVDVSDELDNVLRLIPDEVVGSAEVIRDFPESSPVVLGNARELSQVFLTVLRNAFQALDEEEGTVTLTVVPLGKEEVVVAIADTGRGMSEEQLAKLFDVSMSNRRGRMVAGFGLPAARSILHRHGGEIGATSVLGEGTVVRIRLPVAPATR